MLTFFEYLRRRACQSVVEGVQDALSSIDSQEFDDAVIKSNESIDVAEEYDDESGVPAFPANQRASTQSEQLPPPRRRGRPKKKKPQPPHQSQSS